jgi:PIN domain nuclease of toxin-antitoxin system
MLLLDTHVLVWLVEGSAPLGRRMARQIEAASLAGDGLAVASISFWELAMLADRGRIALEPSLEQWRLRVLALGIQEVPLTGDIAIAASRLAGLHADPADRIIVATGLASDAILVTADERILGWTGELRRRDARR